jgi:hypothetical protein
VGIEGSDSQRCCMPVAYEGAEKASAAILAKYLTMKNRYASWMGRARANGRTGGSEWMYGKLAPEPMMTARALAKLLLSLTTWHMDSTWLASSSAAAARRKARRKCKQRLTTPRRLYSLQWKQLATSACALRKRAYLK